MMMLNKITVWLRPPFPNFQIFTWRIFVALKTFGNLKKERINYQILLNGDNLKRQFYLDDVEFVTHTSICPSPSQFKIIFVYQIIASLSRVLIHCPPFRDIDSKQGGMIVRICRACSVFATVKAFKLQPVMEHLPGGFDGC